MIDTAIPGDTRIKGKMQEKMGKHEQLKQKTEKMWHTKKQ